MWTEFLFKLLNSVYSSAWSGPKCIHRYVQFILEYNLLLTVLINNNLAHTSRAVDTFLKQFCLLWTVDCLNDDIFPNGINVKCVQSLPAHLSCTSNCTLEYIVDYFSSRFWCCVWFHNCVQVIAHHILLLLRT